MRGALLGCCGRIIGSKCIAVTEKDSPRDEVRVEATDRGTLNALARLEALSIRVFWREVKHDAIDPITAYSQIDLFIWASDRFL